MSISRRSPRVIIESPFAGSVNANLAFLRRCLRDSFSRGEIPFASHGLYTQEGVLDDTDPAERRKGMRAGFAYRHIFDVTAVYLDRGISSGMADGIRHAVEWGHPLDIRYLVYDPSIPELVDRARLIYDTHWDNLPPMRKLRAWFRRQARRALFLLLRL